MSSTSRPRGASEGTFLNQQLRSRCVLVTGSSGFVGSHLVRSLKEKGFDVVAPLRDELDVTRRNQFNFDKIDHVIHLAGAVPARTEAQDDGIMIESHVMGTINTLDFAREKNCSVTYVSSFVYGPATVGEIGEGFPVVRSSPYARAKIMAENICREFSTAFSTPVAVVRPFNLYGPGQRSSFVIPRILESFTNDSKILEMQGADEFRDFLHVADLVDLLARTISWERGFAVFNAGSGRAIRISEVIDMVAQMTGVHRRADFLSRGASDDEPKSSWADITRANNAFSWAPSVSLRDGLQDLLDSYQRGI